MTPSSNFVRFIHRAPKRVVRFVPIAWQANSGANRKILRPVRLSARHESLHCAYASATARGREHSYHARGGGGGREPGHALFDGQRQLGDAASREEGVLSGFAAVSA